MRDKRDGLITYLEDNPGTHKVRDLARHLQISEQWVQETLAKLRDDETWAVERVGKGPATRWSIQKVNGEVE